jgi:hypothetical protein
LIQRVEEVLLQLEHLEARAAQGDWVVPLLAHSKACQVGAVLPVFVPPILNQTAKAEVSKDLALVAEGSEMALQTELVEQTEDSPEEREVLPAQKHWAVAA